MASVIAAMVLSSSILTTSQGSAEDICKATISVDQTDATLGPFGTEYKFVASVAVDTPTCAVVDFDVMRSYRKKDGSVFTDGKSISLTVNGGAGATEGSQFEPTDDDQLHWWGVLAGCRSCDSLESPGVAAVGSDVVESVATTEPEASFMLPAAVNEEIEATVTELVHGLNSDEEAGRYDDLAARFAPGAIIRVKSGDEETEITAAQYVQQLREQGSTGTKDDFLNPVVTVESRLHALLETDFVSTGVDAIREGFAQFDVVRNSESEAWKIKSTFVELHDVREKARSTHEKIRIALVPMSSNGMVPPAYRDSVEDLRKIFNGGKYRKMFEVVDSGWADVYLVVARESDTQTYENGSTTKGDVSVYGNRGEYTETKKTNRTTVITRTVVARVYWDEDDTSKYQDVYGQSQDTVLATWKGAAKNLAKYFREWAETNQAELTAESFLFSPESR
jgi:hypothetical protein